MIDSKHLEAAAAALATDCHGKDKPWETLAPWLQEQWRAHAQAAITAYHASLASAGDEGVITAMFDAYYADDFAGIQESPYMRERMRAALAVARLSMGEVERAKVADLKDIIKMGVYGRVSGKNAYEWLEAWNAEKTRAEAAEAKVARLREALQDIADCPWKGDVGYLKAMAERVLQGEPK